MSPQKLGSVIAAAFGSVFILANTASFPTALAGLLRVLASGCVAVRAVGGELTDDGDRAQQDAADHGGEPS